MWPRLTRWLAPRHPTFVKAAGWLLLGFELAVDRFRNPGLATGAIGMILYKRVRERQ